MNASPTGYPVNTVVEPVLTGRNRLTTAFRFFLAIPHLFLVSAFSASIGGAGNSQNGDGASDSLIAILTAGVLLIAASFLAFLSWFAILFTGRHPKSFWEFEYWVLRWHVRSSAYLYLLRDEYPPFGEGEYGAQVVLENPDGPRNRLTVAFRLIMLIPHIIVLAALDLAWILTTIVAWFAILFTGSYPSGLYEFGVNVFRWNARVSAYGLLLRDEYPPFALQA